MATRKPSRAASKPQPKPKGKERRRSERRPVLEAFNVFAVVPTRGSHRLRIHDVSDHGVGFDLDLEGAGSAIDSGVEAGEELQILLHFNARLAIPLTVRVTRIEKRAGVRRVGAEFLDRKSPESAAFGRFIALVDALIATGRF
jgi:hypothetical protein